MKLRLRKHRNSGNWYIVYGRNTQRSTGTADRADAERILKAARVEAAAANLHILDRPKTITVAEFLDEYERWSI